jgi:carbonic anhydrase
VQENYADLEGAPRISACVQENVLTQLENLRTHPSVAARLARGQLNVHGWVYKIETGQVFAYDPVIGQFAALTQASIPAPSTPKRHLTVSI